MNPDELIGRWMTNPYGAMELEELAFRPDGTGWWRFTNPVSKEHNTFRWRVAPGMLILNFDSDANNSGDIPPEEAIPGISPDPVYYPMRLETAQGQDASEPHPVLRLRAWVTSAHIEFAYRDAATDPDPR